MAKREGFHTITPYLIFDDANAAFDYYKQAFGAVEISRHVDANGVLRHGELQIGDSAIMMCNTVPEYPEMKSPAAFGGSPMHLFVYCGDADAMFTRAVEHRAKILMPMDDKDYGRTGGVLDPFGYTWWITTHR
jgi:PhnB protein